MSGKTWVLFPAVFFTFSPAFAQGQPAPADERPPIVATAEPSLDAEACTVGGTVSYQVKVEWESGFDRALAFKPFEPPLAQGLDVVRRSQKTGRAVEKTSQVTTVVFRVEYLCSTPGEYELGPVNLLYDEGGEEKTLVVPVVSVTVRPGPIARLRQSKPAKVGFFIGGLAAFWVVIFFLRRRKKRKPAAGAGVRKEPEGPPPGALVWEELAREAKDRPTGEFYARLENALWLELFRPDDPPAGTTATRLAALSQSGAPGPTLDSVRNVVNACQQARFSKGAVSQGDALAALQAARRAISEKDDTREV